MINNDGYIQYNHTDKSLLRIVKIVQFKSKGRLQGSKLITTLKINKIDITNELRKIILKDSFAVKLIEQLKTRLIEGFVIIENLLTF